MLATNFFWTTVDSSVSSSAPVANGLLTDLLSYWALDSSGTPSYGSVKGNYVSIDNSTGIIGESAHFSVVGDYIPLSGSIGPYTTASYSFWVYPNSRADDGCVLANSGFDSRIFLTITNGWVRLETNTNGQEFQWNSGAPGLNTWSHVVIARAGDNAIAYVNGVSLGQQSVGSAAALTFSYIGIQNRSLVGNIDEVGVWTRQISATDASALYNKGAGLAFSSFN